MMSQPHGALNSWRDHGAISGQFSVANEEEDGKWILQLLAVTERATSLCGQNVGRAGSAVYMQSVEMLSNIP